MIEHEAMHQVRLRFARQGGVASIRQLRADGLEPWVIHERVRRGDFEPLCADVVRLAGTEATWRQAAIAATLPHSRPALALGTALRWEGVDGFDRHRPVEVIVVRGTAPMVPSGVRAITSRRIRAADIVESRGVRIVDTSTSLVMVAGLVALDRVEMGLDHLIRSGTPAEQIDRVARRWRGRGVRGSGVVGALVERRFGAPLPRSWFERLAHRALVGAGVVMEHEYEVRLPDGGRVVIDLAIPALRVGVEAQSWAWHGTEEARRSDAARRRRLTLAGWRIVEVWWSDLLRVAEIAEELRVVVEQQRMLIDRERTSAPMA